METNVTVQVHLIDLAQFPQLTSQIVNEKNKYRIYVNDHLLTERDWIWSIDTYIEENIRVDIKPNSVNSIVLEPIYGSKSLTKFASRKSLTKFALRNLKVNGELKTISDEESTKLTF
jgi:hypothetical protein